ncbi:DUF721 domain-containing protein [Roseospira visakhapatnamensis]|uniref:DUF721 domain-containing protein n=1 Tax=Roseospira visakhapatnamensis TaxID=390880 RepID=A0A7W6W8T0_9PROT|nr:DUF721 domain-containing protein [Roseospira visakhapatnamensis]MBB4265143.1 hypothetical protein [Roseospira visakhapatnamensis]
MARQPRKPGTRTSGARSKPAAAAAVPAAWLRRLVTEEGERLPVRDLGDRSRRTQTVGRILEPATRRLLGRRGLALGTLMTHWEAVVGAGLARHCIPVKLVMPRKGAAASLGGVLHVKAAAGAMATELMHRAPLVCERINATLGYRAVERMQVTQGPLPGRAGRKRARGPALPPAPPSPARLAALDTRLAGVEDPDLRAALARLGKAVLTTRG